MIDTGNIFLQATRLRLRFPSAQGQLSTEDLWDIPLTSTRANKASLKAIGAALLAKQRDLTEADDIFGDAAPSKEKILLDLQVRVVRTIGAIRQEENKAKTEAAAKKAERERLEALIREREGKELPLDALKARLAELG